MKHYISTTEETEGGSIERIFATDQLSLELWATRTGQEIREQKTDVLYGVGVGGSVISEPIIHNGIVYVGSCDRNMYTVSLEGKELWRFPTNGPIFEAVLHKDTLYFGSFDGNFYAVGLDGSLKWKFACRDKIGSKPLIYKDVIYFGCKDKNFYALSLDGKLLWKYATNAALSTDAKGHGDNIYFGGYFNGKFYCVGTDGALKWEFLTGEPCYCGCIHDNTLFFNCFDKNIYALNLDGTLKWKKQFSISPALENPTVHNNRLYTFDCEGRLLCLDLKGNVLWKFVTKEITYSHPVFHNGRAYFGSGDSNFYCIDEKTGKLIWKYASGGPITNMAALSGNKVIYGGFDCNIYCLSTEGKLLWKFPTSLSYIAPVAITMPPQETQTFEVIIPSAEPVKTEEKYKGKVGEHIFGGSVYSGLDLGYAGGSVYTDKKKKRYR